MLGACGRAMRASRLGFGVSYIVRVCKIYSSSMALSPPTKTVLILVFSSYTCSDWHHRVVTSSIHSFFFPSFIAVV